MSKVQRVAIVANPIAGLGRGRSTARRAGLALQSAGIDVLNIQDLRLASRDQLAAAQAIVAIGGDGTLRAVASRCLELLGSIPPLLPVPMGTANLMGRYLHINWSATEVVEKIVQSLVRASVSMLDAAEANGQLFFLMAGVGIDAQIVHELDRIRQGPINYASYIFPAAMAVTNFRSHNLHVAVDEEELFPTAPAMALVANVSEYGTGFPLAPHARPDDGMLDICVIPVKSPVDAVQKFFHAAAGEHLLIEGVVYTRGKQIQITSIEPAPLQIDGDSAGHTPVSINLLPMRVPFIVPV